MKKGFTLIELLIVISIISVISTVGLTNFQNAQGKARDSVRKNDLTHLALALDLYSQQKGKYVANPGSCQGAAPAGSNLYDDADFAKLLVNGLPKDPKTGNSYCYESADGLKYKLYAKLEDGSDYILASEEFIASNFQPAPPQEPPPAAAPPPPAVAPPPPPAVAPPPPSRPSPCRGFSYFRDEGKKNINISSASQNQNVLTQPIISSWDDISKVEVYEYQDAYPLTSSFISNRWKSLGTITRQSVYECLQEGPEDDEGKRDCRQYGPRIVDYTFNSPAEVCLNVSETGKCTQKAPAVAWRTSDYTGNYYAGMEVFDGSGTKFYSWNTENCREDLAVNEDSAQTCDEDDPVYPVDLKATTAGSHALVQWKVNNHQGDTDVSTAYISSQAGFTADASKRVVSRLKAGSGNAIDATNVPQPAFYKVTAFNTKGESPSSTQGYITGIAKDSGTDYSSPPDPYSLVISGTTFTWKYGCCVGINIEGWKVVRSDGVIFDVKTSEVSTSYRLGVTTASWTMPTAIPGTYYVQAYRFRDDRSKIHLGNKSNTATLSQESTAANPPAAAPSSVVATTNNNKHPITISWTDSNTNEAGFHIYRSNEPLDLTKSSSTVTQSSNKQRYAYYANLASGKHYVAVKAKNRCGEGWSNYIEVNIGGVNGVSTDVFSLIKTTVQSFFSGFGTK